MEGRDDAVEVSVGDVWHDAWAVYTLLFRRSVAIAFVVYAVIEAATLGVAYTDSGTKVGFELLGFVLALVGPVLVQGSLVAIVRNVHEGARPETMRTLIAQAYARIGSLVWAALVYGFGVAVGLIALIVPGLLAASRWSLMAPLIMLEKESAGDARRRSRELVKPYTWTVLGTIIVTGLAAAFVGGLVPAIFNAAGAGPVVNYVLSVIGGALTAPFLAHVLTVIYYRITSPNRPVISADVGKWQSVWEGA